MYVLAEIAVITSSSCHRSPPFPSAASPPPIPPRPPPAPPTPPLVRISVSPRPTAYISVSPRPAACISLLAAARSPIIRSDPASFARVDPGQISAMSFRWDGLSKAQMVERAKDGPPRTWEEEETRRHGKSRCVCERVCVCVCVRTHSIYQLG